MKVYIINVDEDTEKSLTNELTESGFDVLVFEKITNLLGLSAISGDSTLIIGDEYHIDDANVLYENITAISKNPIVFIDKDQTLDIEADSNLLLIDPSKNHIESLLNFLSNKKKLKVKKTQINRKDLSINIDNHLFSIAGKNIYLTNTEFSIIHYMMASERMNISHEDLMIVFRNKQKKININTLANHIRNINNKIFQVSNEKRYIKSVYGFGYGIESSD